VGVPTIPKTEWWGSFFVGRCVPSVKFVKVSTFAEKTVP
jgi:hypothetical protein